MYASFFGLKEMPFNLTPDSRYFFLSRQHREALNYLLYGIHERKGFVVLTGGIGTGKTTLCRALLAKLDPSVETALIFNSFMSELEILETAAREFGVPAEKCRGTVKGYIDALNEFLLANFSAGRTSVLIIDEAQNLSRGALEQIRMISNLETEREKLIQIVLIGQPELRKILESPSLRQLNERINVRCYLVPLNRNDVREYMAHRLSVAGGNGSLKFTESAYRRIFEFSKGIPRRINAVCDRALLIAYTENCLKIKGNMIRKAVKDIQDPLSLNTRRGIWVPISVLLTVLAVGVALAGIWATTIENLFRSYLTW
jgi:general secretion pathway protein A